VSIFKSWFGNAIDDHVELFKQAMDEADLPVRIAEVKRSQARQEELYAQGRTTSGPIVTWTLRSKHLAGRAFDFDFVRASDQDDDEAWIAAGEIGSGLGLVWGADLGIPDFRHFELPG
jgi:peptidoglycan L-alanyl-D-glutamate endopeptidase CwlK